MGFYALAISVVLAAVVSAFGIGYGKGSASRNSEIAEYQAAIEVSKRLAAEARREAESLEASHNARLADIAKNIVEENARHEEARRRAVAGARALVLRDQPKCPSGGGGRAETLPGPEGSNGEAICKLPAEIVRDMESLVFDADRDVRQLGRAQEVIEEDRKVCGGG